LYVPSVSAVAVPFFQTFATWTVAPGEAASRPVTYTSLP